MATSIHRETAKIYQFPVKLRSAPDRFGDIRSAPKVSAPGIVPTAYGSGWYHDDAIRDAEEARKN